MKKVLITTISIAILGFIGVNLIPKTNDATIKPIIQVDKSKEVPMVSNGDITVPVSTTSPAPDSVPSPTEQVTPTDAPVAPEPSPSDTPTPPSTPTVDTTPQKFPGGYSVSSN